MTFLVDSHCHLASLSYAGKGPQNIADAVNRAHACGVSHFLCVACTPAEYKEMKDLTAPFTEVYKACGVHPLNLEEAKNWSEDELKDCLKDKGIVGVGETGLDYHYALETRKEQLDSFARQIAIANEVKLPLIIHAREAHADTVSLMKSENARDVGGVMHCFCDEISMARECLDLGFYISFSGIATFKAGENVREVLRYVPLDRMLVETDCPYLAPVPVRGVENEPAFVRYTLECAADIKGVKARDLASITSKNFEDLFNVKLSEPVTKQAEISSYKIEKIMRPL
ncbi:TatD family hydrolase [uncultured Succinatimonas sp.]|mgnify:CR=1 FL=1|uniref:TatD family hydrolase n=1 Tax=uncultured Succinatimonas sp. TaxID=1262973 RepID=UPI0025ED3F47|nr:TatD family hydrolase [uncultured Succinatimonas sp.]